MKISINMYAYDCLNPVKPQEKADGDIHLCKAENLVYQVTMKTKEAGFVPMLYTNADYEASNACYEKIGYVIRGKLCTVG